MFNLDGCRIRPYGVCGFRFGLRVRGLLWYVEAYLHRPASPKKLRVDGLGPPKTNPGTLLDLQFLL